MMEDDQLNVTEALTGSATQSRSSQEKSLEVKNIVRKCKRLIEKSQDLRFCREEHYMMCNKRNKQACTPKDVWEAPLNILEEYPIIWAAYNRGKNDDTSSKTETLSMEQSGTLEPGPSKVTKHPVRNTKLPSKELLLSQKMKLREKFASEFYQYMLTHI